MYGWMDVLVHTV